MEKDIRWVKIAESEAEIKFKSNGLALVDANGKKISIGRYEGQLYAFADRCPHASGLFVYGTVDEKGNVVCPLHRYKFCMKNGRNVSGEGYYLKHWPVKVEDEGVFVGLEATSLFGLL